MSSDSPVALEFTPPDFTEENIQARLQSLKSLEHDVCQQIDNLCRSFDCTQPDSDLTLIATKDITQPLRWRFRHSRLTELPFYLLDADDEERHIYTEPERLRNKLNYKLSAISDEHTRLQRFIRSQQAFELALSPISNPA